MAILRRDLIRTEFLTGGGMASNLVVVDPSLPISSKMGLIDWSLCFICQNDTGEKLTNSERSRYILIDALITVLSNNTEQIVKCSDITCCKKVRSDLRLICRDGSLPPPYVLDQTIEGLVAPKPNENELDKFASLQLRKTVKIAEWISEDDLDPYQIVVPDEQISDLMPVIKNIEHGCKPLSKTMYK
ncbi:hypothetical protein FQA39_LY10798 [Lamprigera yunnana]|nr:hypothetical protein FQA39_LY10798 [Lamprigera yunnana]